MTVTSSMWTGVSGLMAHGEKMSVVGNNIANVNTVGFKSQRMDFEDFVYQYVASATGNSHVGRGVAIGAVYTDYSQSSFENSNEATDLGIAGKGLFQVRNTNTDEKYYTRAGNFRFNKDGYLVDPHGYALQGWEIERKKPTPAIAGAITTPGNTSAIKGTGVPKDIRLDTFTCEPKHTNSMTIYNQLSSEANDNTTDPTDPFFALAKKWNGTDPATIPPLGENAYSYQTSIVVYDEGGTKHELTAYFDPIYEPNDGTTPISNWTNAERQYEYIVTMKPEEDLRVFDTTNQPPTQASRGLLMMGTITFNADGTMKDTSAYVPATPTAGTLAAPYNLNDPANWTLAPISSNGYPMMTPNFSGIDGQSTPFLDDNNDVVNPDILPKTIEFNMGIRTTGTTWDQAFNTRADAVGTDLANKAGFGLQAKRNPQATTNYGEQSATPTPPSQDGYSYGFLSRVTVDRDGILHGVYSNGQTLDLYQITLYDFMAPQGLYHEGGNLYSETRDSGEPATGPANSNGFGQVYSNSLEISNVDLAREFVNMITTQRGFQANSKTITTVDTMLETVISMKR